MSLQVEYCITKEVAAKSCFLLADVMEVKIVLRYINYLIMEQGLEASFNNVFTLQKSELHDCPYMPSMSLIRCKNEALKKIAPQMHHLVLQKAKICK